MIMMVLTYPLKHNLILILSQNQFRHHNLDNCLQLQPTYGTYLSLSKHENDKRRKTSDCQTTCLRFQQQSWYIVGVGKATASLRAQKQITTTHAPYHLKFRLMRAGTVLGEGLGDKKQFIYVLKAWNITYVTLLNLILRGYRSGKIMTTKPR